MCSSRASATQDASRSPPPSKHGRTRDGAQIWRTAEDPADAITLLQLHRGPDVLPIPDTTSLDNLQRNLAAYPVPLTPEQFTRIGC